MYAAFAIEEGSEEGGGAVFAVFDRSIYPQPLGQRQPPRAILPETKVGDQTTPHLLHSNKARL